MPLTQVASGDEHFSRPHHLSAPAFGAAKARMASRGTGAPQSIVPAASTQPASGAQQELPQHTASLPQISVSPQRVPPGAPQTPSTHSDPSEHQMCPHFLSAPTCGPGAAVGPGLESAAKHTLSPGAPPHVEPASQHIRSFPQQTEPRLQNNAPHLVSTSTSICAESAECSSVAGASTRP